MNKPRLALGDFAICLASSWKLLGHERIPEGTETHQSLSQAFEAQLKELEADYSVDFRIRPNKLHGTSQTVADIFAAIYSVGFSWYIHPHDGFLRLNLPEETARYQVSKLTPRAAEAVRAIAQEAVQGYQRKAAI